MATVHFIINFLVLLYFCDIPPCFSDYSRLLYDSDFNDFPQNTLVELGSDYHREKRSPVTFAPDTAHILRNANTTDDAPAKQGVKSVSIDVPSTEPNANHNPSGTHSTLLVSNAGESGKLTRPKNVGAVRATDPSSYSSPHGTVGSISTTSDSSVLADEHSGVAVVPNYPEGISNQTLREHQIDVSYNDTQAYYSYKIYTEPEYENKYWVDMDSHKDMKVNELLSKSHRRAATLKLSFLFPFYGHMISNVTVATGGFLYAGDYVHSWLAATQYIAPLMANFDTRLQNNSFVKYADNGTTLTVFWENVVLQDSPEQGEFSFQVTLCDNGDIIFVYKKVPFGIHYINDNNHPVKVGLSDAYIMHRHVFLVRRKTIYEYHRIGIEKSEIRNGTVVILKSLPSCLNFKSCDACLAPSNSQLKCLWCDSTQSCSTGVDRYRQQWLLKECDKHSVERQDRCVATSLNPQTSESASAGQVPGVPQKKAERSMMGVMGVFLTTVCISGAVMWVLYAYRYPHSMSGQILIRYRPSTWGWRREAGYTAATIHM